MIPGAGVLAAFLAIIWGIHHPFLGIVTATALVLLAVGLVRFCREIAPALAVRSWASPARPRPPCPSCGWGTA